MKKQSHFEKGTFKNLVPTKLGFGGNEGMGAALKESFFGNKKIRSPQSPIQNVPFDLETFLSFSESYVWFGHSSLLMRLDNLTIAIDPVFGRASPFSFIGPKPFSLKHPPQRDDLPSTIDVLLLTHDHYDHLEYRTIKQIHHNISKFIVPLKVKRILIKWGVPKDKIKELDWYDSTTHQSLTFTYTPSRHFSGRGLTNRNSTLWGGYIISSKRRKLYFTGDSGYADEFKKIGRKYGPFDIVFVENGQYNKAWIDIHMYPEQAVQAGIDAKGKVLMPIHWGKYDLSVHPWKEPIERFVKEAKKKQITYTTPQIGEIFTLEHLPSSSWWKKET